MAYSKGILVFPAELLENILIISASCGWPASIAALSQTCKYLYNLVYHGPDKRLWREIFLSTFDDPRPALEHLRALDIALPDSDVDSFNWALQYQSRIQTKLYLRRSTSLPINSSSRSGSVKGRPFTRSMAAKTSLISSPELILVLKTLLSVIATSSPFPSSPTISFVPATPSLGFNLADAPPFPPMILLLCSQLPSVVGCRNTDWLEEVLARGFPAELTRTLFATLFINVHDTTSFKPRLTSASYWQGSEVAYLFHKLVSCTGFLPILGPRSEDGDVSSTLSELPLVKKQYVDARSLARRRVYDMRYLRADRCWGPFLPVVRKDNNISLPLMSGASYSLLGSESDSEDEEEEDISLIVGRITGHEGDRPVELSPPIRPEELLPDYVWLASARIVLEANLREVSRRSPDDEDFSLREIVPALRRMECLRIGGTLEYWNAWNEKQSGNGVGPNSMDNGKGKARESDGEGWDWAGVAGIWKRCICWLDYRELLIYNLPVRANSFLGENIQEALRIIPMTVKVVGYSKPPPAPSSSSPGGNERRLPIIHVEGESRGSDLSLETSRFMKGTVSMIGDGTIRWSLVSTIAGTIEPEWSSEAVQIGGPGAAGGLLGMWTGAQHERPDPLGPFWAWKVA
ncbi:hypothetical protein SERLA73DRAFT_183958 [Serpula lacrymans var. lacrymans S7.3]|uniref:F-box domain-containing protein n=2 Tax=Serpula lacrymans var. lacrymans TaxID=341189 RepID=F8Q267_SERL3|nr:uncharacterized protein SERLADRAFT_471380 [Serpula lacrymans var. lacrymans S7.9]EGN97278.1 hypothetical protein SERLA73DRAFT_183958 [Serpula lacrymans var. lacrymans S7.3]EGO22873.1 hypothetical protein SERLADRAFT_471380 [Serpula lacrymans var. lacrymans S7.9]